MKPLTGVEISDGARWTTRTEEDAFLQRLATETDVEVTIEGYSVMGNPIWCAALGSGSTLMVAAGVHGAEPSGRDAALAWLRDLAYSTDSEVESYLASHRVVVVPNINVDGSTIPLQRDNANGVNINRDYIRLAQPEARAVARVVGRERPVMLLDMHEVGDDQGAIWRPFWETPNADSGLQALGEDLRDYIAGELHTKTGETSLDYQRDLIPWAQLSSVAYYWHAVGLLSEVSWRYPNSSRTRRFEVSRDVLDAAVDFHRDNRGALDAARSASESAALTGQIRIPTHERAYQGEELYVPASTVHTVEGQVPQELFALHGISHSNGQVDFSQPAGMVAAALLAPDSTEQVANLADWERAPDGTPPPSVATAPRLGTVSHGATLHPITQAWVGDGETIRPVLSAWTHDGANLYPVQ